LYRRFHPGAYRVNGKTGFPIQPVIPRQKQGFPDLQQDFAAKNNPPMH
jgi:hypothetical protein